jgi:hypothetical protein
MNIKQLFDLLNYVKANNSWGIDMYDINCIRNRKSIKYIDFCFDSRDGTVWNLTCRSITGEEDKSFIIESEADLNKFYEWLNEPLSKSK